MKTVVYFVLTCLISTGLLLAALNEKNPLPEFIPAFAIWLLFFWTYARRMKRREERRSMEKLFREFMRSKYH